MTRSPLRDTGLHHRLVGRGHRVGDHREVGQVDTDGSQTVLIDDTQPARWHDDVGGEAALNVVARHLLVRADRRLAALAGVALAARDHCGNDDRAVGEPECIGAGIDDVAADLMPERQRQFVLGAHAVVIVAKIGVADATAGDFDQHFVGGERADVEFHRHKRLARAGHHPPNWLGAHRFALHNGRSTRRRTRTQP